MAKIPISVILDADPAKFMRAFNLGSAAIKDMSAHVKALEAEQARLDKSTSSLLGKIESLGAGITAVGKNIQGAFMAAGAGGGVAGLLKSVADLNKKMYDLSKTAAVTGQNFSGMLAGMKTLNAETKLSIMESATFFETVSKGTKGVRMSGEEVAKLGKTLANEFGPTLEDVTGAFQKLAQIQEKDIFLFRRLNENISAEQLGAYAAKLTIVNKASEEQIATLFRAAYAMKVKGDATTSEQKKMLAMQASMQELKKTFDDLAIKVGRPLMDVFNKLAPAIQNVAKFMGDLIDKNPELTKLVGSLVMVAPILGSIGKGIGGIGSLGKMAFGSTKGSSPANAMWVKSADKLPGLGEGTIGGPGGPAGGGWGGKISKGLGLAAAGQAVGYGGQAIAGAVGGRAGSGLSAASRAGEYALTGAAIGSVIPGLGTGVGAAVGGIVGLISSLEDLEDAFTGTRTAAEEATKKSEKMAEAEKELNVERGQALEKEAGVGSEHAMFGGALAMSRLTQKQLMSGGMSKEAAQKESENAAAGKGSSAFYAAAKKVRPEDVAAEMAPLKAEMTKIFGVKKADEQTKNLGESAKFVMEQFKFMSLSNLLQETAQVKELFDGIIDSLGMQADLMLELTGDAEGAQEILSQSLVYRRQELAMLEQQRDRAADIVGSYGSQKAALAKVSELTAKGADLTTQEREELDRVSWATSSILALNKQVLVEKKAIAGTERKISETYEPRIDILQSELSLMESQAATAKEMYLGAGPTLEFQIGMVQKAEEQKKAIEDQISSIKTRMATQKLEDKERIDLKKQLLSAEQKHNELIRKQLEMTKNLREGYLDALTTMTNAEGTFAKFVLRKEMGMGELQRNFLAAGGMRTGMVGAGTEAPTTRWKAGGGPGALQFMGPQAFAKLAGTFGEEYGPQTVAPNVSSALAQTPLGQFGAQSPESGVANMGGRAGPGITIQSPMQQAQMQSLQKKYDKQVMAGEGTAGTRAEMAKVQTEAAAGTFEGQVLNKMDKIIAIISGGKPTSDKPANEIKEAVQAGVKDAQVAVETKNEQAQRQEASKQAAEMRRGTNVPTDAEAAAKKEADKLAQSEKIEQAKFNEHTKRFNEQTGYAAGVNTTHLGIGKGGGAGARGVAYAGEPGKGMTTAGAKFETPFTSEQIKAVSQRLPLGESKYVGVGALTPKKAAPDVTSDLEDELAYVEERIGAKTRASAIVQSTIERDRAVAAGETPAEKELREEKQKQVTAKAQLSKTQKAEKGLVADSGIESGWLNLTGRAIGDVVGNARDALGNTFRAIGSEVEKGFSSTEADAAKIQQEYESNYAAADQATIASRDREKNALQALNANRDQQVALQRQINERETKMADLAAKATKSTEERQKAQEDIKKGEELLKKHQEDLVKLSAGRKDLEQQMDKAAQDRANNEAEQAAEEKRIGKVIQATLKETSKDSEMMAKEEASFKESRIFLEGQELSKSKQQYEKEQKALSDQVQSRQENVALLEKMINTGQAGPEAEKQLEENREALNGLFEKQTALQEKGFAGGAPANAGVAAMSDAENEYSKWKTQTATGTAGASGTGMSDTENEYSKWRASAEGQKQIDAMNKVHSAVKEGSSVAKEVGQAQVDAQKESGENLKSSLEQQKIDVTPVVTNVNPACATAVAGASTGGWIARMAGGGKLPGFGGGDRVLAMLEPGEMVINKNSAAAFPGLLEQINNNRFATGGMVPSPSMARQGGTVSPSFNISVRGDTAKALVGSVSNTLSGMLNDMFTPQGTSGRLFDLGS